MTAEEMLTLFSDQSVVCRVFITSWYHLISQGPWQRLYQKRTSYLALSTTSDNIEDQKSLKASRVELVEKHRVSGSMPGSLRICVIYVCLCV